MYIESSNIISSLGWTTKENIENILNGRSGIKLCNDRSLSPFDFPLSAVNNDILAQESIKTKLDSSYSRFEKLCILSIIDALKQSQVDLKSKRTLLILSTTKGNIDMLDQMKGTINSEILSLNYSANRISCYFDCHNKPVIISNACVSGVLAIVFAKRMCEIDAYDHFVVVGADVVSKFIVSGFQSFLSLSKEACKPFDAKRNGLSLGEGASTIIFSKKLATKGIKMVAGSTSNDANHISGPSRTGEGLWLSIHATFKDKTDLGFISAHGTATSFNDEMEAKAIARSGLIHVPVNSFKGYFGHTLGAAGVIETLLSAESLKRNLIIGTLGYDNIGVSEELNLSKLTVKKNIKSCLKLASGFGGCNATLLLEKDE